jgi:hypothetical protein
VQFLEIDAYESGGMTTYTKLPSMYVMGRTGGEQALCSWDFFTKHTASC